MQKNILKKFIVLFSLSFVLFGFNFVFAEETPKDIIVKDECTVKDTNGIDHIFPEENSTSKFLGVCALVSAKEAGYINNFELINDPSLGLYIGSINDQKPSSTEYWAIYINGGYASCGIGCLPVSLNDTLSFVLSDWVTGTESTKILFKIISLETIIPEVVIPEPRHGSSGSMVNLTNIIVIPEKTFSITNAFEFLYKNQKSDQSYGAPMYTDWVAIAISTGDNQTVKSNLINYFKLNPINSSILTDYERRAMALMSLGVNPYNGTEINYIKKITDSFDGKQFGDNTLDNDDIFALVVLKNSGYGEKDEIILKDINYIISKQESNGSFGNIDMTSAFIQALKGFENTEGVKDSISKAENYLISKQEKDGGFENSFSTSWVLQSLFGNDKILKAEKYLISKQEKDGGIENIKGDMNYRIWATAYTIPAILHKPWSEILNNFSKPIKKEVIKKSVKILEQDERENLLENQNLNKEDTILPANNNFWSRLKNSFKQFLIHLKF